MSLIRNPAVAGMFYPAEPGRLAEDVRAMLDAAGPVDGPPAKALIAPHAGYVYSGPIAAAAYARLKAQAAGISRVVLIGPTHRLAFRGIASSGADRFATPLGQVPLDTALIEALCQEGLAVKLDAAHQQEHCLEVHLPFLQSVLGRFTLVPLLAGASEPDLLDRLFDRLWDGPETLILVSSDLSHYLDYHQAQAVDLRTARSIEALDAAAIEPDQACGATPVTALLRQARRRHLAIERLDLRNSGDTAGPRDRVVGYGAWLLSEAAGLEGKRSDEAALRALSAPCLDLARRAIAAKLSSGQVPPLPAGLPSRLLEPGAAFVTLRKGGALRGCIGSSRAWRPLAEDIVDNAVRAGWNDPRFPVLKSWEWPDISLSVSILTEPVPLAAASEEALLAALRPHRDGLILEENGRGALFLPAVWDVLPDPRDFLRELKMKAGLAADHWSERLSFQRFSAVELDESGKLG